MKRRKEKEEDHFPSVILKKHAHVKNGKTHEGKINGNALCRAVTSLRKSTHRHYVKFTLH